MSDPAKPSRFRQAAIEARERANAYKEKRESRERKDAYEEKRQTAKAKESTRKGDKPEKNPEVAGGQPVKFFTNAQGQVIPITPASGEIESLRPVPAFTEIQKTGRPTRSTP
jgi:DNA-nicking Smr family endonuclease